MCTLGARKVTKTVEFDDDLDLAGILKNLSPDANWIVKIYRREAGTDNWLEDLSPADINEQVLAQKWGAGRYLVRPWNDADRVWGRSKVVNIAADAAGAKRSDALQPRVANDNLQFQMLQMQMQMQQKSSEQTLAMFQQFNTSIMGLMTALITRPNDTASIIAAAKELGGGGAGKFAEMREMIGLAKELSPGGGKDDDPITSVLTMVLPKLMEARQPPALPPAPPVTVPNPPPEVTEVRKERAPTTEVEQRLAFLSTLKAKARDGKDVDFWADYIEENAEDATCQWILAAARDYPWPVLWQGLLQADPELKDPVYENWFQKLYLSLVKPEDNVTEGADA